MKKKYTRPTMKIALAAAPSLLAYSWEGTDQDLARRNNGTFAYDDEDEEENYEPLTASPVIRKLFESDGRWPE